MVTIKEIASHLNLSISTVSKGLRGATDVSYETRREILKTASSMGYESKRTPHNSKLERICVFAENVGYKNTEQFGYEIIAGLKLAASRQNCKVDIVSSESSHSADFHYDEYMIQNNYKGGFALGFTLQDCFIKQLEKTTIPTVLLDNVLNNKYVARVGTDSFNGMALIVSHLHELGHRKIAMLNGEAKSLVSFERKQGMLYKMKDLGMTVYPEIIVNGHYRRNSAKEFVSFFLQEGATAIVCASDMIANTVIRELYALGVRVPEEISVTGFDDLPIAKYSTPSLTTVRQNRLGIGQGVFYILKNIEEDMYLHNLSLKPELIIRDSTTSPK